MVISEEFDCFSFAFRFCFGFGPVSDQMLMLVNSNYCERPAATQQGNQTHPCRSTNLF